MVIITAENKVDKIRPLAPIGLLLALVLSALLTLSCSQAEDSRGKRTEAERTLQPPKPDPRCSGLPQDKRVEALGIKLGSCLWETQAFASSLGLELKGDKSPNTPEHVWPFVLTDYAGTIHFPAPVEKFTQLLFDQDQTLFAIRANYLYKRKYAEAREAFQALDSELTLKYGEAHIEPFTKRWQNERVTVELRFVVDVKSHSNISLTYFLNEISRAAIGWPKED